MYVSVDLVMMGANLRMFFNANVLFTHMFYLPKCHEQTLSNHLFCTLVSHIYYKLQLSSATSGEYVPNMSLLIQVTLQKAIVLRIFITPTIHTTYAYQLRSTSSREVVSFSMYSILRSTLSSTLRGLILRIRPSISFAISKKCRFFWTKFSFFSFSKIARSTWVFSVFFAEKELRFRF